MFSDERKELQKIVLQNGGQFSTALTRKCTHLIANISFGALCILSFQLVCLTERGYFAVCLFACSNRTDKM
jgi:hypothetical protein